MDGKRTATQYEIDVMLTAYGRYIMTIDDVNYKDRMFYSEFLQSIGCEYQSDGASYREYYVVDEPKFTWTMLKYTAKTRKEN